MAGLSCADDTNFCNNNGPCAEIWNTSSCFGGTMNVSDLQQTTGALGFPTMWVVFSTDDMTIVSDVQALKWTTCNSTDVFPTDASECPPNNVEGMGTVVIFAVVLSVATAYLFMKKSTGPGAAKVQKGKLPAVPWGAVLVYWISNFWMAMTVSLLLQSLPTSSDTTAFEKKLNVIALSFTMMIFFWDVLVGAAKKYIPRFFFEFLVLYAASAGRAAANRAYTPSVVAVVGHHVLLLGFINFLLGIPKAVVKTRLPVVFGCSKLPEGYALGWYEILTPIAGLFAEDANGLSEHTKMPTALGKPLIAQEGASQPVAADGPSQPAAAAAP